jgi:hypothetical protein
MRVFTKPAKLDSTEVLKNLTPATLDIQLSLFEGFFRSDDQTSHTLDLDTLLPHNLGKTRKATSLDSITREIRLENRDTGATHSVTVKRRPAVLDDANSKGYAVFPAAREAIVERAIRKLAVQQTIKSSLLIGKTTGLDEVAIIRVTFTLYQLRKELAATHHGFRLSEIKEAIEILATSHFQLSCENDKLLNGQDGTLFQRLHYSYPKDDEGGEQSVVQVDYHPLATHAIRRQAYFPINYKRLMALKGQLAAWLTTRLNQRFRQAQRPSLFKEPIGYHISLATILRESGLPAAPRLRDSIATVRKAIREMVSKNVLKKDYTEKLERKKTQGRPEITGAVWTLYPSDEFTTEIIAGNDEAKRARNTLSVGGNLRERGIQK